MTKKALGAIVSKVCVLFNDLGFFCFFLSSSVKPKTILSFHITFFSYLYFYPTRIWIFSFPIETPRQRIKTYKAYTVNMLYYHYSCHRYLLVVNGRSPSWLNFLAHFAALNFAERCYTLIIIMHALFVCLLQSLHFQDWVSWVKEAKMRALLHT